MSLRKNILTYFTVLALGLLCQINASAQNKKSFSLNDISENDNIYMTWNKNTPESEMKDDIKALAEKGVTIKYSNIKRNSKDEITGLKISYSDRKGNKGTMELDNQSPINTIKFYKQGDEVGFGEPSLGNDMFGGNNFMHGFAGADDIMRQFNFKNGGDSQSFSFSFPQDGESNSRSKSRMSIQKDGKKPLVIEDGEIIEGGDDYSPEELEDIKKSNKIQFMDGMGNNFNNNSEFDFRNSKGLEEFKKQMEKVKTDTDKKSDSKSYDSDIEKTKEEMIKAKEEMIKAKEEMEKAKKDLEKAKSTLKTQKS